ncbi:MAG: DNA-processing protein DprA [Planctomycetota bacterium]
MITEAARQYIRLHLACDVGPIRLRRLLQYFGTIEKVLSASSAELQRVEGVGPIVAKSIQDARNSPKAETEIVKAEAAGVRIVCQTDIDYPKALLNMPDAPICLYFRGDFSQTDTISVAIVGTRKCSHYGREQAIRFSQLLARAGFTIVSGLARGIDGCAHRGALEAGGRTIAVLGNGLSHIYPPEHKAMADEIAKRGTVISEVPMDCGPESKNFPGRNRLIAGLTLGTLVVEAGERSGALITARLASEYNREVFAVPGRLDDPDRSVGVNALIRDGGAKLVTCLEDILSELGEVAQKLDEPPDNKPPSLIGESAVNAKELPTIEQLVYRSVENGLEEIDALGIATGLDAGRVSTVLTSLELKGLVRRLPGNRFSKRLSMR